jgi:hypothetical protein
MALPVGMGISRPDLDHPTVGDWEAAGPEATNVNGSSGLFLKFDRAGYVSFVSAPEYGWSDGTIRNLDAAELSRRGRPKSVAAVL